MGIKLATAALVRPIIYLWPNLYYSCVDELELRPSLTTLFFSFFKITYYQGELVQLMKFGLHLVQTLFLNVRGLSVFLKTECSFLVAWRPDIFQLGMQGTLVWLKVQIGLHLQGTGAGVFENFMRKGRGQQPLWPSAGINCWYKSLEPRKHEEKAEKWNRVGREGEGRLKKWRTESEQSSGEWECSSQWS